KFIATRLIAFLAGTPSAILDTAGAGTHPSAPTRDPFGVATAKVTFAVLIPSTVGILVTATLQFLTDGLAPGPIGRDLHPLTHCARQKRAKQAYCKSHCR